MVWRVGLIIPSSNRMVEQEMVGFFPKDVVPHVTRLRMTGGNRKSLDELLPEVEAACAALADAKCDAIAFHCTANSMSEGSGGEERLLAALSRAGAPQALTTSTAITQALRALHATSVALVTPYDQKVTDHEAHFLEHQGFTVPFSKGWALAGSDAYCATPPQVWLERMLETRDAQADAVFLSCANVQGIKIVDEVEGALGVPMITSNQAVIFEALRLIGWRGEQRPPGRVFETLA
ncbi:MAG: maleate cis-trans isomerase [Hyphomicrobiales bacterium]|nr:maleate cis-trans isomerase [Hyphomicrobiales bacterium]